MAIHPKTSYQIGKKPAVGDISRQGRGVQLVSHYRYSYLYICTIIHVIKINFFSQQEYAGDRPISGLATGKITPVRYENSITKQLTTGEVCLINV